MEVAPRSPFRQFHTNVWQAPLIPAAAAVTVGAFVDRYVHLTLLFSAASLCICLFVWQALPRNRWRRLPLIVLAVALVAAGAMYHHWRTNWHAATDVGNFAGAEPQLVRLRGLVIDEPRVRSDPLNDPLRSYERAARTIATVQVTELRQQEWSVVSGRVRLTVTGLATSLRVGDIVEVVGRLSVPESPGNPGEFDYASELRKGGIRAVMFTESSPTHSIVIGHQTGSWTIWLGDVRSWARQVLSESLSPQTASIAAALLLGDGSAMTEAEWEKFRRTGVMHVLVVSGQHLVILAGFLWFALRLVMVRRRYAAVLIVTFLILHAALTGGRPPVIRAAVMVCIYCGAILLTRIPMTLNTFALAWLVVFAFDPKDLFDLGCQLSFLSVAVLFWCSEMVRRRERDPLDQLVNETRPAWERSLRWLGGQVLLAYIVTCAVSLAVFPLTAAHYHLIPVLCLVIGPPVVLFSSVALIAGFLLLFTSAMHFPLRSVFAQVTDGSIGICQALVDFADQVSLGRWFVPDISAVWLGVFYLGLVSFLLSARLQMRWRLAAMSAAAWLCVGLVGLGHRPPEQLRCTFLAVGHGGCTVLEAPDGRVLLYDAGAMSGPEVTQRQIAPFLWSRGIRRVDEVFLSHADLDHFNGIPALLDRFAVGQITCTPSFADKSAPGVMFTLNVIERHRVPMRIVKAGDKLRAGDVQIDVLHPPLHGPEGRENFRSMVLYIEHAGQTMLLTGDLEGPGLEQVVRRPLPPATALMAPHHGSRAGDLREQQHRATLVRLTQPKVVVACQDRQRASSTRPDPYQAGSARYLGTWPHGAITFHFRTEGLEVETYRSQQHFLIPTIEQAAKNQ